MSRGPVIITSEGSRPGRDGHVSEISFDFAPCDLTFIRIEHFVRLQFDEVEVTVENDFTLDVDGTHHELDPGDRADLGPLLALYPATLRAVSADNDGTLNLVFDSDAVLSVPPHPSYEPWQIAGPGSALVVCVPGIAGAVAIWE